LQIQVASLKTKGKEITPKDEEKLLSEIIQRYEKQTSPFYAAARLWVDDIIDPADTRKIISESITAANNNNEIAHFKTGVIQV
jgi:acetyl-CoA carboxylase carboxyltransferase component